MKKNKISSYLIFISIFTAVTIFVLIIQKSYNNLIIPTKQVQTSEISKDINPNLDLNVIEEIKSKQHINPSDLPENESATSNVLIVVPTPVISSSSSESVGPKNAVPTAPLPTLIP